MRWDPARRGTCVKFKRKWQRLTGWRGRAELRLAVRTDATPGPPMARVLQAPAAAPPQLEAGASQMTVSVSGTIGVE